MRSFAAVTMHNFSSFSRPPAASPAAIVRRNKAIHLGHSPLLLGLLLLSHSVLFSEQAFTHEVADGYILARTYSDGDGRYGPEAAEQVEPFLALADDGVSSREEGDDWGDFKALDSGDVVAENPPRLRGGVAGIHVASADARPDVAAGNPAPVASHTVQVALHITPLIVEDSSEAFAQENGSKSLVSDPPSSAPVRTAKQVKFNNLEIPIIPTPFASKETSAAASVSRSSSASPGSIAFIDASRKSGTRFPLQEMSHAPSTEDSPTSAPKRSLPVALPAASTLVNNPLDVLHTLSKGVSSLPNSVLASLPDFSSALQPKGTGVGKGSLGTAAAEVPSLATAAATGTTKAVTGGAAGGNFVADLFPLTRAKLHSMLPGSANPSAEENGLKQAFVVATDLVGRGTSVIPEVGAAAAQLLSTAGEAITSNTGGLQLLGNNSGLLAGDGSLLTNAQQGLNTEGTPHSPLSAPVPEEPQLLPGVADALHSTLLGDGGILPPALEGRLVGEGGLLDPSALGQNLLGATSLLGIDKLRGDSARAGEVREPTLQSDANVTGEGGRFSGKVLPETKIVGEGGLLGTKVLPDKKFVGEGGFLDPKRLGEAASNLLEATVMNGKRLTNGSLPGDTLPLQDDKESAPASPVLGGDDPGSTKDRKFQGENAGLLSAFGKKLLGSGAVLDPKLLAELRLLDSKILNALLGAYGSGETLKLDVSLLDPRLIENLKRLDLQMLEDLHLLNPEFLQKLKIIDPKWVELLLRSKEVDSKLLKNLQLMDSKIIESLKLIDPKLLENLILTDSSLLTKLTDPALLGSLNLSELSPAEISDLISSLLESGTLESLSADLTDNLFPSDGPVASLLQRKSSRTASPSSTDTTPLPQRSATSAHRAAPPTNDSKPPLVQLLLHRLMR